MIFYKRRNQAAQIWQPKGDKSGSVVVEFERIKRDIYGIDGMFETEDPKLISLLKGLGYQHEGEDPRPARSPGRPSKATKEIKEEETGE